MTGAVVDMSRRGLSMQLPQAVPLNSALQVETPEAVVLGEVRYCAPEGDGFRIGLSIRHALTNLAQLRAWNRQLEQAQAPTNPVDTPVSR